MDCLTLTHGTKNAMRGNMTVLIQLWPILHANVGESSGLVSLYT